MIKKVGVLSLQGNFASHSSSLEAANCDSVLIKDGAELARLVCADVLGGLVIPGGESTTLLKLLTPQLEEALYQLHINKIPILATCAGLILLSKRVCNNQKSLGLINCVVDRNGYGRQKDSFQTNEIQFSNDYLGPPHDGVFIRAPKIDSCGKTVKVLGSLHGHPVLIKEDNVTAATYHPELSKDPAALHKAVFGEHSS